MSHANIHPKFYIKATRASRILGVEWGTLSTWAKAGRLPYIGRSGRSHWRFNYKAICKLANATCDQNETCTERGSKGQDEDDEAPAKQDQQGTTVETIKEYTRIESVYAHVSTRKQLKSTCTCYYTWVQLEYTQVILLHAQAWYTLLC